MPSYHLTELVSALKVAVGKPPFRRPSDELQRECEAEGLSNKDFIELLSAIAESKHGLLAGRSIRLLISRNKLDAVACQKIVAGFSLTSSSFVRLCWARYLCTAWDADAITIDGRDCLRAGYGVFFHFLQNEKSQKDLSRFLYRITRKVDVTSFRCREISRILRKLGPSPTPTMALAELYDSFAPNLVAFPPKEHGLPGSSGLTAASRVKMHEKMMRSWDEELAQSLRKHCIDSEEPTPEQVHAANQFKNERIHTTKKPRLFASLLDASTKDEQNPLLSDVFRVSRLTALEGDPKDFLSPDVQAALLGHLITWDGRLSQDETFAAVSRVSYPARPDQEMFERSLLYPLLDLFSTCTSVFKFRCVRALAKMLGNWIETQENIGGQFYQRIISSVDDSLCLALIYEADDPLIQLASVDFYSILGNSLLKRPKLFASGQAPAIPPSKNLVQRLLLSPSVVGIASLCGTIHELIPVFRVEHLLEEQTKKATAVGFEATARDVVKCVALGCAHEVFDEILNIGRNGEENLLDELRLGSFTDELGIVKSFAFAGFWKRWWDERDEPAPSTTTGTSAAEIDDSVIAAYLLWLGKKTSPGIVDLVSATAAKFQKLIKASKKANEEGEEEEIVNQ